MKFIVWILFFVYSTTTAEFSNSSESNNIDDVHKSALQYLVNHYQTSNHLIPQPEEIILKLKPLLTLNATECVVGFTSFLLALPGEKVWAVTMFDSYGKLGSGITRGNLNWPGDFNLCFTVVQGPPYGNRSHDQVIPFHGKYCWSYFNINASAVPTPMPDVPLPPLQVGLCVPDSCTADEIHSLLHFITEIPPISHVAKVDKVFCIPETKDFSSDVGAIISLVVFFCLGAVIFAATVFDLYLKYFKSNAQLEDDKKLEGNNLTRGDDSTFANGGATSTRVNGDVEATGNEIKADYVDTTPILHEDDTVEVVPERGVCSKIIISFSAYSNIQKLLSLEPRSHNLGCLNGIRVLSMIWIIFAQTFVYGAAMSNNLLDVVDVTKTLVFQLAIQAVLGVDTFYVLSGILVSYLYFKHREQNDWKINWIIFYIRRYWRLTPVYILFIFIIDDNLINYITNGPYWPQNGFEGNNCKENWWWNLLYINNYISTEKMCLSQSWFLANEMQFFVLSPILLVTLTWYVPSAIILSALFLVASWITSGIMSTRFNLEAPIDVIQYAPKSENYFTAMDELYVKPYFHAGAYVIGVLCGWILYETKCRVQLKKYWVILGWILSTACNVSLVVGLYHTNLSPDMAAIFNSLSRTAWAIGVSWIIFACCNGYGGIVNYILSHPTWQPLSRLTYCAFLLHYLVISVIFCSSQVAIHFSYQFMVFYSAASILITYIASLFLSMAFEMPFLELTRIKSSPPRREFNST